MLGKGENYREIMVRLNCDEADFLGEKLGISKIAFLEFTHETS